MKFNFKKISALLSSVVMIGATAGTAIAANYPAPFVSGSSADVAIVYGTGAGAADNIPAANILQDISERVGTTSSGSTATGGDSVLLAKDKNKFNLNDQLDTFYPSLDVDELSVVLADGTYTSDDHEEYDYEQAISVGDGMTLTYTRSQNVFDNVPFIGFSLADGQHVLNYSLTFDEAVDGGDDWENIIYSYLPLLGSKYYVLDMTNTSATNHKITLLNSAADGELSDAESVTLTAGDKTYEVSASYIDDNSAKLTINGEVTDDLEAGETQKLSTGDYVGIKSVGSQGYAGGISYVSFSIGSGKLILENIAEVQINGEDVSTTEYALEGNDDDISSVLTAYIDTDGEDLEGITLEWNLDSAAYLVKGGELLLPGFETVKVSYADWIVPTEEVTEIKNDGDAAVMISTEITDGSIELDFLSLNDSQTGFDGLGKDSDEKLVTSASTNSIVLSLNESESTQFVATWISGDDYESYVYEIEGIKDNDGKNETTLSNVADSSDKIIFSEVGKAKDKGEVTFTLTTADDEDKNATITLTRSSGSGTLYADRIVTKEGLQFRLPIIAANTTADGYINFSTGSPTLTSWSMNLTEEDKDGNIASSSSKSFTVTIVPDADDGGEVSDTSLTEYETEDDSDVYEAYVLSDLATRVAIDKSSDLNLFELGYHGSEAYAEVYIAETGVSLVSTPVSQLGEILVTDAEIAEMATKNLIIVGGSCINSAAAHVLGGSYCGAAFTEATGVGTGEFLIKGVSGAYTPGKIALIVAGYNAVDTVNAATYLTTQTVDTSKAYKGTTSTAPATLITEA